MTVMVSFRADEADMAEADRWAEQLGMDRSEVLREALVCHLARLGAEADVAKYAGQPFTTEEKALDAADDWGPAQDWSDWAEWADRSDHAAG
ncbi:MAG: ribbon-helix-helix protein, CopG family [Acidimicrobiales bacterium]